MYYVLMICWILLSKYGNLETKSSKFDKFGTFLSKKSLYFVTLEFFCTCHQTMKVCHIHKKRKRKEKKDCKGLHSTNYFIILIVHLTSWPFLPNWKESLNISVTFGVNPNKENLLCKEKNELFLNNQYFPWSVFNSMSLSLHPNFLLHWA